jgi:hypothetical protein
MIAKPQWYIAMRYARRTDDRNTVLTFWRLYKPYVHIIGFIVTITFIGTMAWASIETLQPKIDKIEERVTTVEQKQNNYEVDFATVKQEVHDIHEHFIGSNR